MTKCILDVKKHCSYLIEYILIIVDWISLYLFHQRNEHALFDLLILTPLNLLNLFLVAISWFFLQTSPLSLALSDLDSHITHIKFLHLVRTEDLNTVYLITLRLINCLIPLELSIAVHIRGRLVNSHLMHKMSSEGKGKILIRSGRGFFRQESWDWQFNHVIQVNIVLEIRHGEVG